MTETPLNCRFQVWTKGCRAQYLELISFQKKIPFYVSMSIPFHFFFSIWYCCIEICSGIIDGATNKCDTNQHMNTK